MKAVSMLMISIFFIANTANVGIAGDYASDKNQKKSDVTCDTNLKSNDPTSKYILALDCLNHNLQESKKNIVNLQTQIDGLKAEVSSVKSTADEALSSAQQSESTANKALATSNRTASDVEAKLNAGFKHHMLR